jgi:hypothetical protein
MLRRLRISVSVLFAILAIAACVLWARSYGWVDYLGTNLFGSLRLSVISLDGRLTVSMDQLALPDQAFAQWYPADIRDVKMTRADVDDRFSAVAGFGARWSVRPLSTALLLPDWFVALSLAALASVSWPRWKFHFSLRTMLVATTVSAVLLGLIVWAASSAR